MSKTRINKLSGVLRVGVILIFSIMLSGTVYASAGQLPANWEIPFLGTMKGPEGFKAVEFEKWVKDTDALIASQKGILTNNPAEEQPEKKATAVPENFKMYQLQVNDGKSYHIAIAFAVKDTAKASPETLKYFTDHLSADQEKKLKVENDKLRLGAAMVEKKINENGIFSMKVLNLNTASRVKGTKQVIYQLDGRVLGNLNGIVLPVFAKVYIFEKSGQIGIIGIMTEDNDGAYWDKVSTQMIKSLYK